MRAALAALLLSGCVHLYEQPGKSHAEYTADLVACNEATTAALRGHYWVARCMAARGWREQPAPALLFFTD